MGYPTGANVPDREEGVWGEVRVHRPNPRLSINSYGIKCPFCGEFAIRKALTSPTNFLLLEDLCGAHSGRDVSKPNSY